MALELKITAEIVDAADGGVASVTLSEGRAAAAIAMFARGVFNDLPADDVAMVIARNLSATAAGSPPGAMSMRPGSTQWNLAREALELSEDEAQAMGTAKLATDFSAFVASSNWRDFLKGREAQRYDGGGIITLTQGSDQVIGEGTTFQSANGRVIAGKTVLTVGGFHYGIKEVVSDSALVLDAVYEEDSEKLSPRHYSIDPA